MPLDNLYAPPESPIAVPAFTDAFADEELEAIRREHVGREAALRFVGLVLAAFGGLGLFLGALWLGAAVLSLYGVSLEEQTAAAEHVGELAGVGLANLLIWGLSLALGLGLRRFRRWARWGVAVLGGLFLVAASLAGLRVGLREPLIGLALFGIYVLPTSIVLYLLLSPRAEMVFAPEYAEVVARTPHVRYKGIGLPRLAPSPRVRRYGLLLLSAVAAALVLAGALILVNLRTT